MITIAKRFTFDAAHCLPLMPDGHKCQRLHGHTYAVEIQLTGDVDPATGLVVDYDDIAKIWAPLHDALDHRYLNDVLECPTTENLVLWIVDRLRDPFRAYPPVHKMRIRVSESSTTWAESGWVALKEDGLVGFVAMVKTEIASCFPLEATSVAERVVELAELLVKRRGEP
jgi:6-pyruvoyltetrahydropterin/6-carboxytetrahydropterin synthase